MLEMQHMPDVLQLVFANYVAMYPMVEKVYMKSN